MSTLIESRNITIRISGVGDPDKLAFFYTPRTRNGLQAMRDNMPGLSLDDRVVTVAITGVVPGEFARADEIDKQANSIIRSWPR